MTSTQGQTDQIAGERLASRIAELTDDKQALDIVVIDVRGLANFTDFFVIATGRSDRQVKAIHDAVREGTKRELDLGPIRTEGERERSWILLDYGDCIVHVMLPEVREYYRLEQLWGDAPRLEIEFAPHVDASSADGAGLPAA